jgi:hypothetical protein
MAQELLSRAEGQSQAIINAATAEARAVKEIARSIAASGENPAKYLLAMKCVPRSAGAARHVARHVT